ncbi:MAG TPA: carbamoyltransferase C-terminal domain-containing protein [Methylomirabilota bacterium]|nr:carbamoyltransferase C-terminal domain-containing protein [Methylomirabilota bacterium]
MLALGIWSFGRSSAAALVNDASVLAAIEEEKLFRTPGEGGIPRLAINFCLERQGVRFRDVSAVAFPRRAPRSAAREAAFLRRLQHFVPAGISLLPLDHHHCHAASAFLSSDLDRALILTLDEAGDGCSGLAALGEGNEFRPLQSMRLPNSLGWFYSRVTELAGLRPSRDEHKLQWLSKDGTPEFAAVFRRVFRRHSHGFPVLHRKFFSSSAGDAGGFSREFYRELGLNPGAAAEDPALRAALARSAQVVLEELVLEIAERFRKETRATSLCLAGGVFLNVLLVRALETNSGFHCVYVQPVSGNAGAALGAALLARAQLLPDAPRVPLKHLYLGPEFPSVQIKPVLDNCKISYKYFSAEDSLLAETVQLLLRDKIVAWCHGRTEFGHRALGNRSIVASPFSEYVVENVNEYIKHRENFHPFALSVPAERAAEFFDCTANCRFMASLAALKQPVAGLERFAFHGSTVRVHLVDRDTNPLFWRLLHKFGESAPAPVLVNTSFNLFGEPLVSDPREAVRSFYSSGIDALAMGPFLVVK